MKTQIAIFSKSDGNILEQDVNEFLEKMDTSDIISITHKTISTDDKWRESIITVLIVYKKYE